MRRLDPFSFRMLCALIACMLALLVLLTLPGCTLSQRDAQGTAHTRVVRHEEPTATGGKLTLEETWSETADSSTTTHGFDPAITDGLQQAGQAALAVARGDYGNAITYGLGAVASAAAV